MLRKVTNIWNFWGTLYACGSISYGRLMAATEFLHAIPEEFNTPGFVRSIRPGPVKLEERGIPKVMTQALVYFTSMNAKNSRVRVIRLVGCLIRSAFLLAGSVVFGVGDRFKATVSMSCP